MLLLFLIAAVGLGGSQAGPLSKFEERTPALDAKSPAKLEDLERCLIDMQGLLAPTVFRQPDRPDKVTLIWKSPNGLSVGRIDLQRETTGTHVRSWFPAKQVARCVGGY